MSSQENKALTLDLTGIFCPEVVLRVRSFIESLPEGATLNVISTDPLSVIDLPLFAMKAGHDLKSQTSEGEVFRFVLTRGP